MSAEGKGHGEEGGEKGGMGNVGGKVSRFLIMVRRGVR